VCRRTEPSGPIFIDVYIPTGSMNVSHSYCCYSDSGRSEMEVEYEIVHEVVVFVRL
jgi:hypothetical protein